MTNDAGRESIVGLARQLVRGAIGLVRTEIASARQELGQGLGRLGRGAAFIGIAVAFVLLLLMALVVLLIAILDIWLPLWASALIFMAIFLLGIVVFGWLGYRRLRSAGEHLQIPETRASVQEDIAWAKRLLRREEK
jgi:uncharacterized membrane protein YqjE